MTDLTVRCVDSPKDFISMGQVYEHNNEMYVSIEMPAEEKSETLMCNMFIGKAEAIQIIKHLKNQFKI